jgi:hypothetical protein
VSFLVFLHSSIIGLGRCTYCYMLCNENDLPLVSYYIISHLSFHYYSSHHRPNVWFSSLYILVGASIIAVMLTVAGNEVEEAASMSMFDALQRRENYESQMARDNPLMVRIRAFLAYNAAYLICILLWILWMGFIMAWAMIQVPEWDFGHAQYFAVSLCSSAGSFSLPTSSSNTAYGLAGLSMMVGVPLMAMGVSSVIIMLWQGHRFQTVKLAAWEDVTQEELKLLNELGVVDIGEGEELTKGGFILLGLLRMGQDVGVIKYLADAHETIQDRGGVIIRETSDPNNEGTGYYSKQAQALIGDSKDEVDEMLEFTSHTSSAASTLTPLFKASTAATVESKRNANDRSWSTTAGFDSGSSRNFSGLSQVFGGGGGGNENDHYLATIDESLTTSAQRRVEENDGNGTIPSRLDSDIATILTISRLDSDIGISIKSKDSWDSNNP